MSFEIKPNRFLTKEKVLDLDLGSKVIASRANLPYYNSGLEVFFDKNDIKRELIIRYAALYLQSDPSVNFELSFLNKNNLSETITMYGRDSNWSMVAYGGGNSFSSSNVNKLIVPGSAGDQYPTEIRLFFPTLEKTYFTYSIDSVYLSGGESRATIHRVGRMSLDPEKEIGGLSLKIENNLSEKISTNGESYFHIISI